MPALSPRPSAIEIERKLERKPYFKCCMRKGRGTLERGDVRRRPIVHFGLGEIRFYLLLLLAHFYLNYKILHSLDTN